jgi:hypothetical protein
MRLIFDFANIPRHVAEDANSASQSGGDEATEPLPEAQETIIVEARVVEEGNAKPGQVEAQKRLPESNV